MCFQFILPVLNLLVFFSAMLGGWFKTGVCPDRIVFCLYGGGWPKSEKTG